MGALLRPERPKFEAEGRDGRGEEGVTDRGGVLERDSCPILTSPPHQIGGREAL